MATSSWAAQAGAAGPQKRKNCATRVKAAKVTRIFCRGFILPPSFGDTLAGSLNHRRKVQVARFWDNRCLIVLDNSGPNIVIDNYSDRRSKGEDGGNPGGKKGLEGKARKPVFLSQPPKGWNSEGF
jgi:hypothetical protein